MLKTPLLVLAVAAAPLVAQSSRGGSASAATAAARLLWEGTRDNVTQSAADVPENLYSYRPTPEVRTFGEIIGHVAGSQTMFCALVLGEPAPTEDAVEKTATTKAALVAALKQSNDYCARAYAMTDQANAAMVDLFGQQRSKLFTLLMNASHDSEHYGNIVTYMRLNKMVPSSSRR
ncbi:MAG: DinB family protein [bacterium]